MKDCCDAKNTEMILQTVALRDCLFCCSKNEQGTQSCDLMHPEDILQKKIPFCLFTISFDKTRVEKQV